MKTMMKWFVGFACAVAFIAIAFTPSSAAAQYACRPVSRIGPQSIEGPLTLTCSTCSPGAIIVPASAKLCLDAATCAASIYYSTTTGKIMFTDDISMAIADVTGSLVNTSANNGGSLAFNDSTRWLSTTTALLESSTTATAGVDTAFTLKPLNALDSTDKLFSVQTSGGSEWLYVTANGNSVVAGTVRSTGAEVSTGGISVHTTSSLILKGNVADGGTAIANKVGNSNALATTGAKILSLYSDNMTTERAYFDYLGGLSTSSNLRLLTDDSWVGMDAENSITWNNSTGYSALNFKGTTRINIDSNNNDPDSTNPQSLIIGHNATGASSTALVTISESGKMTVTDAVTTTSVNFSSSRFEDLRVPLITAKPGATKAPGFSAFKNNGGISTGTYAYHFDAAATEEVFFSVQLPHGYKEGTALKPHVHYAPITTDTGNVVFELECTSAAIDGTFGNTSILNVTDAVDGTAYKHQLASFTDISGTGLGISSVLMCRIARIGGDANDTYSKDVAVLDVDFHYEIDTVGSSTATAK